jgi:recA bacterial DNA recombination protein
MARISTLESLKTQLQNRYGERSAMLASEIPPYRTFSTGSLALDYATGVGGLPTNRVVEFAGAPGVGKTTITLHAVNNCLKLFPDRFCLYIDAEHRLTPDWVKAFVEDWERVIVVAPDHVEQATDMYTDAVSTGECAIAVFDSIGGTPSQRVTGKSAEIGNIGGNALAITRFSQFAQIMSGKYETCTIGINQIREDMSGYHRLMTPGGKSWQHAASLRVELKRGQGKVFEKVDGDDLQVGFSVVAKVHKNSLSAPGRSTYFWFYNLESKYGFGIDFLDEITRLAMLADVIENPARGTYTYPEFPGGKIRGKDNVILFVKEHPEIQEALKEKVLAKLKGHEIQGVAQSFDIDNAVGSDFDETGFLKRLNED